jgi:predicted glycosyltransferase involved in capsule biosynthesis
MSAELITFIIPFTPTTFDRQKIYMWLRDMLAITSKKWSYNINVIETDDPFNNPRQYNKAAAIISAFTKIPIQSDIIVIHDADVWCGGLPEAISMVSNREYDMVMPHNHVVRYSLDTTQQILSGQRPIQLQQNDISEHKHSRLNHNTGEYTTKTSIAGCGGIVVINKSILYQYPPDIRFQGWGAEDEAWFTKLSTLCNIHKCDWPLFHLYHAAQELTTYDANFALYSRYKECKHDKEKMTILNNEAISHIRLMPS